MSQEQDQKGRVMRRKNPFVQIDKTPIEDPRLSWKATGLMTYFASKPDNWEFRLSHIIASKKDGEKAVRSGINELKKAGYIVRVAYRKNGKVYDYDLFVYEEPVKYPTEKDLHIDLDLWEKYKEEHKDDDLIDITVAAKEIKEWKEKMKQVSQNRQPEKNQGFEQVSQNGKPEENQGSKQVSGFQQAGFQEAEKAVLSNINYLSDIESNKNNDDDNAVRYQVLQGLFILGGGQAIKRHDLHYPKFVEALNEIGSWEQMVELANRYIALCNKEKKEERYHETPQIAWFIGEGWKNFRTPKVKKMYRLERRDILPKSVQKQIEQAQAPKKEEADDEDLATKQARVQAKLKLMYERLNQRKKRQENG